MAARRTRRRGAFWHSAVTLGDVLALLFMKGEATMNELAAFAHRTKPTTTVLVDKLEEMGLVRRMLCVQYKSAAPGSVTPADGTILAEPVTW